ncbi:potassium transporter TrkA [Labilibaculum sp. A4]|uniref:monovalent cation:proton antiporter family protein n=1 Tax=Labilibaculum euxinus TaxID=2686357 RepID=UPI000F618C7C|nr:cation:proton antiporter [Labilibaculum euxinus]MDQ1771597.1 cation:proton antiporter [Labilibaculum euxinus]MWN76514.1 potassium transporter TrkA [Labilibaculum euxinus]
MNNYLEIIVFIAGFLIVATAANRISKYFPKVKLPVITGLLFIGIVSGPFVLNLIPKPAISKLYFINEISLSFIAFVAGAELYLKELKGRMKSIKWMTFGQLFFTFVLSGIVVMLLSDHIHFLKDAGFNMKLAIVMLIGVIFVARSPVSAIAVINEMRAKGPFTQTAIGVTVVKDVLVIILFTICFAVADALISDIPFDIWLLIILFGELCLSLLLGFLLGLLMNFVLELRLARWMKSFLLLLSGYSVYLFAHFVHEKSQIYFGFDLYIEPLLVCIIGSFVVVNFGKFRREFVNIIQMVVPFVYVVFFTLTGASISIDILKDTWAIALLFFTIRLISMAIGAFIGGSLGGDPPRFNRISWMPYVTQAGVAIGLVEVVSVKYPEWGPEFSTILIAVIVLNQILGPPLFKWSILLVGESHKRRDLLHENKIQKAIIFGLEGQSLALARQLKEHDWVVKLVTRNEERARLEYQGVDVTHVKELSLPELKRLEADKADAIVLLNQDEDNLKFCELAYEHFGTRDIVVRVNERSYISKFHELGALIVEPSTVMVSLMDHLVRSPIATSLLLGMEKDQDTVDIEMQNKELHGITLRDLQIPTDVIILATKRNNNTLISTGYTRLRLGDVLTVVGSVESLEKVRLKMEDTDLPGYNKARFMRKSISFKRKSIKTDLDLPG